MVNRDILKASDAPAHWPIEYRLRPSRSFRHFASELLGRECEVMMPGDIAAVQGSRQCREFIRNDGEQTFMVHSTGPASAEKVFSRGFTLIGMANSSRAEDKSERTLPALQRSFVLLAGPSNKDQQRLNSHALAYRYKDPSNGAKMVFAFPVTHDGGQNHVGLSEFQKTPFGRADGEMIVRLDSDHPLGEFHVPGRFAVGYFDLDSRIFVYNPQFNNALTAVAPKPTR